MWWEDHTPSFKLADDSIKDNCTFGATIIFDNLFRNDFDGTNLKEFILAISDPNFTLYSKEFVKFAKQYYGQKINEQYKVIA